MASRPEYDHRYNVSEKGRLRQKRYRTDRRLRGKGGTSSPSPPSWSTEAQRARRARPEYVLAKKLGVSVKTARAMLEAQ